MSSSYRPQNEDGRAHLVYFDKEHQLSFVWSGLIGEPIEICFGGYGEQPFDKIDTSHLRRSAKHSLDHWVHWYRITCVEWVRDHMNLSLYEIYRSLDESGGKEEPPS